MLRITFMLILISFFSIKAGYLPHHNLNRQRPLTAAERAEYERRLQRVQEESARRHREETRPLPRRVHGQPPASARVLTFETDEQ